MVVTPRKRYGWPPQRLKREPYTDENGITWTGWQVGDRVRIKDCPDALKATLVEGPFHTDTDNDPRTGGGEYWKMETLLGHMVMQLVRCYELIEDENA